MQHWRLPEIETPQGARSPVVLHSREGAERAVLIELRAGEALGAMPPSGLPDAFLEGGPDSLRQLVLRFAKGRGPFTTVEANVRFGRDLVH